MFKDIPYFHLLESNFFTESTVYEVGEKLSMFVSVHKNEHPYYCITPKEFEYYGLWIYENIHFNDYEYYSNDDEYDERYVLDKVLTPLMILKDKFIFFKATLKGAGYYIEEIYDAKEVFEYWINQNHFTDLEQWKHIGIGKSIFNLLPANHNYYDRNEICTCGHSGCYNSEVWYIKYTDSYAIPFVNSLQSRLVFDLHYFDKYEEKDYIEENYSSDKRYSTFPFLFEAKTFKLMQQSVFANE